MSNPSLASPDHGAGKETEAQLLERLTTRLDPVDGADDLSVRASDYDLNGGRRRAGAVLRRAAVLAVVAPRPSGLMVTLTRRADHLARHPGQIAFPGGRIDPQDANAAAAALREAEEEIGLPRDGVEMLGAFDPYETATGYCVTPFVGVTSGAFKPRPEPGEVAEVFEAPLSFLLDPANLRQESFEWRGGERRTYVMRFGARRIWGATAGMIRALQKRVLPAELAETL